MRGCSHGTLRLWRGAKLCGSGLLTLYISGALHLVALQVRRVYLLSAELTGVVCLLTCICVAKLLWVVAVVTRLLSQRLQTLCRSN